MEEKPVKYGLGYICDHNWKPIVRSREGAQRLANKMASKAFPSTVWHGVVADCGEYFRISLAGQMEKHHGA